MEKEKRIREILSKTHNNHISDDTIKEFINNPNLVLETREKNVQIFNDIIESENERGIYDELAQKYNVDFRRIRQVEKTMIEKLHFYDVKQRIKKLTKEEILKSSIEILEFDTRTANLLKQIGCTKVEDILTMDKNYLNKKCNVTYGVDYRKVTERIEMLEINENDNQTVYIKPIEELDMLSETYGYLKKKNISTNKELFENIEKLKSDAKEQIIIRKQLKELYEQIKEEFDKYATESSSIIELIEERNSLAKDLEKDKQKLEQIYSDIDKYIDYIKITKSEKFNSDLRELLKLAEEYQKVIEKKENKLSEISNIIDDARMKKIEI